jgi:hypothetical protein
MPRSKTPKQIPQQERHGGLRRTDSFVPAQGPGYMAYAEVDFNAWIRRCHPSGDHAGQLVGFPRAGGSASYYRPLSTRSPRSQSSCTGPAHAIIHTIQKS